MSTFNAHHRRRGSIGLNIEDIEHLLFDQKVRPSEGHKMIKNFMCDHLPNLNQNIPLRSHTKKSSNAAILNEWIEKDELTESEVVNLYLFKERFLELYQLIKAAEKGESIVTNPTEKVMKHFDEMTLCLSRSFGDEEVDNKKAESDYFAMRYNEMLNIYDHYIQNIDSLISKRLVKDKRFKDYMAAENEKRNQKSLPQDSRYSVYFHAFEEMPPISNNCSKENCLGVTEKTFTSSYMYAGKETNGATFWKVLF